VICSTSGTSDERGVCWLATQNSLTGRVGSYTCMLHADIASLEQWMQSIVHIRTLLEHDVKQSSQKHVIRAKNT
jgi:hypothetical protein